jgi:ribosomal protein L11 methyltransferase
MARADVKPGDLLKVTVTTPAEAEELVAALVERLFHQPLALYTDEESLRTEVSVFLTSPRDWGAARRRQLELGLRHLREQGVPLGRTTIGSRLLPQRDWAEAWKRHFRPLDIGGQLLVQPTWSRRRPGAEQAVVKLDPGLSFGTGQHPTTAFCLERVVQHRPGPTPCSMLDVGCGSGILAIAAAKLGYAPVEALDNDPEAVRAARANAALNEVTGLVKLARRDVRRLPLRPPRRFDIVCANLLADLIQAHLPRLAAHVAARGTLVLAGILATEFDVVRDACARTGWESVADAQNKEWHSGAFRRRDPTSG